MSLSELTSSLQPNYPVVRISSPIALIESYLDIDTDEAEDNIPDICLSDEDRLEFEKLLKENLSVDEIESRISKLQNAIKSDEKENKEPDNIIAPEPHLPVNRILRSEVRPNRPCHTQSKRMRSI